MDSAHPVSGELNNLFNDLMDTEGDENGQSQNAATGATLTGWKDLPIELLLRIMSIVGDDRMVIVTSGVCTGWREALGWGITNLSLLW
jgi:F-box and leucine-rich repeat protein 1 (S-phase kinase-associated protein 2)